MRRPSERAADRREVAAQLGRESTIPFTVIVRCGFGHPLVIRNHPVDASARPVPPQGRAYGSAAESSTGTTRAEAAAHLVHDRSAEIGPRVGRSNLIPTSVCPREGLRRCVLSE